MWEILIDDSWWGGGRTNHTNAGVSWRKRQFLLIWYYICRWSFRTSLTQQKLIRWEISIFHSEFWLAWVIVFGSIFSPIFFSLQKGIMHFFVTFFIILFFLTSSTSRCLIFNGEKKKAEKIECSFCITGHSLYWGFTYSSVMTTEHLGKTNSWKCNYSLSGKKNRTKTNFP